MTLKPKALARKATADPIRPVYTGEDTNSMRVVSDRILMLSIVVYLIPQCRACRHGFSRILEQLHALVQDR